MLADGHKADFVPYTGSGYTCGVTGFRRRWNGQGSIHTYLKPCPRGQSRAGALQNQLSGAGMPFCGTCAWVEIGILAGSVEVGGGSGLQTCRRPSLVPINSPRRSRTPLQVKLRRGEEAGIASSRCQPLRPTCAILTSLSGTRTDARVFIGPRRAIRCFALSRSLRMEYLSNAERGLSWPYMQGMRCLMRCA